MFVLHAEKVTIFNKQTQICELMTIRSQVSFLRLVKIDLKNREFFYKYFNLICFDLKRTYDGMIQKRQTRHGLKLIK